MKLFLIRWATTTFAVLIATGLVPGITFDHLGALIGAGLLLGVLNAIARPALMLMALPLIIGSMGLFILVINALLLYLVGGWIPGFHVAGFGSAFFGGIIVSLASWAMGNLLSGPRMHFSIHTFHPGQDYGEAGPFQSSATPFVEPSAPRPGEMKPVEGRVIEPENQPHDDDTHPRQLP